MIHLILAFLTLLTYGLLLYASYIGFEWFSMPIKALVVFADIVATIRVLQAFLK